MDNIDLIITKVVITYWRNNKMPKGFSPKAVEGFTLWMTEVLRESGLTKERIKTTTEKTKKLLTRGFPQVRKY